MKRNETIPAKPPFVENAQESPQMLINEIARLYGAVMRDSDSEITQESTRMIIINLARRDGVTQLDLVRATHLKPPTVSIALKRLETEGFVSRQTDSEDNRAVRVFLTDSGRKLMRDSIARLKEAEVAGMRGISDEESAALISILTKIRRNILDELGCMTKH